MLQKNRKKTTKNRVIVCMLLCSMMLSAITVSVRAAAESLSNFTKQTNYRNGQYSDVSSEDWYADNVKAGTEYGIVKGYGDRFGVSDNITILQSIIIACRIHTIYYFGKDEIEQTGSGTLQQKYIAYALEHDITCGFSELSRAATRAEFAEILASALPDEALKVINLVEKAAIPDVPESDKYASAIYSLYRAGILTGSDTKGRFLPKNSIIRAEACTIATRMIDESLRKRFSLTVSGGMREIRTGEPLYSLQWALHNDGSTILEEKKNAYAVYEPELLSTLEVNEWVLPEEEKTDLNKTSVCGKAGIDINMKEAWEAYHGGVRDTVVAIIDTGIDTEHEDLYESIWVNADEIPDNGIDDDHNGYVDDVNGWNFYDENNELCTSVKYDDHGTHCAGIIAADSENGIGISGIAYSEHVKIMVLKVFGGARSNCKRNSIVRAIEYAEKNGAVICNMSLSGEAEKDQIYQVMKKSKMLFVVAAGNNGKNTDASNVYPASFDLDNIISVANLYCDGSLYRHSNYGGSTVDIAAPGSYILSTVPDNGYCYLTGTSMATPVVTGAAAMIYSQYPNITTAQVKEIILRTAKPLPTLLGECVSGGMLDLGAAMKYDINLL